MSSAVERIPLEIWELILDSTIEVQGLSTLRIGIPSCNGANASYWQSERQRGTLRLVCRGWNQWTTRRAHRLLYFRDYLRCEMPVEVIRSAKHLIVDISERESPCWGFTRLKVKNQLPLRLGSPVELLMGVASQVQNTQIETLHLQIPGSDVYESQLLLISSMMPKLTVLVISCALSYETALCIPLIFPNLLSLSLFIRGTQSPDIVPQSQPEFLKLEFLSIFGQKKHISKLHFETWRLPSLRILQFYRSSSDIEPLHDIFPQDCRGVRVLSLRFTGLITGPYEIDNEFWEFFPNIETLYPYLTSITIKEPPPVSHPFFSLIFSPAEREWSSSEKSPLALTNFTKICTGIRVVQLAMTWDMFCFRSAYEARRFPFWTAVLNICRDVGSRISLVDGDGVPFEPKHEEMLLRNDTVILKNESVKEPQFHPLKAQDPHRCGWVRSSCRKLLAPVIGSEGILLGI